IANFDGQLTDFAVVQNAASAYSDDFATVWLLGSGARQHDAACGLGFFFAATDNDAVMQRTKLHCRSLLVQWFPCRCILIGGLANPAVPVAARNASRRRRTVKMRQRPCGDRYMRASKMISRAERGFFTF